MKLLGSRSCQREEIVGSCLSVPIPQRDNSQIPVPLVPQQPLCQAPGQERMTQRWEQAKRLTQNK